MLPQDPKREAHWPHHRRHADGAADQAQRPGPSRNPAHRDRRARRLRRADIDPQIHDRARRSSIRTTILVEVATKNGEIYYFSDLLNWMLFENTEHPPYSIWAYVARPCRAERQLLLPDIPEIVSNAARSVGTSRYGVPRLPREHMPHKLPRAALEEHWRFIRAELEYVRPRSVGMALRCGLRRAMADADRPRDASTARWPRASSWRRRSRCRRSIRARLWALDHGPFAGELTTTMPASGSSFSAAARANTNSCSGVAMRQVASGDLMQKRLRVGLVDVVLGHRQHQEDAFGDLAQQENR